MTSVPRAGSDLHPATRGFGLAADAYERGRPDYPAAAIDFLAERLELRPVRVVLDLAAGTGKLTRLLVPTGADVIAVEPIEEMRAKIDGARALDGTAEAIPLPDASVDAVTVAQAFHWFRAEEAVREIRRVLRPGGGLALIWNARDERDAVQAALSGIFDEFEGDTPRRKQREWRTLLPDSGLYERCERALFEHDQPVDEQGLIERVVSTSFIAAAPQAVRDEVEARVRAIARAAEQPIRLSYMTELYLGYKPSS
jgi:SAM-dependent methyltransferase